MDDRKLYGFSKCEFDQRNLSEKQEVGRVITCFNSRNIEIVTAKGIVRGITSSKILKFQDKIFLVTSMNQDFNPRRMERYIAQAQACGIE